ncbi:MAG: carboxypeptidase-like regulatory domain-containing protein [Acidobacteriota bacterium]|nr:carboxypeptidase-like regulatory domain-containing protein [Acidobacteriota bacterium]
MARFVDSRSNQPITRWKAFLKSSSGDGRTDLEEFLVQQPIGANTAALDFASVPTGSWKLTLKFDDRGTRVQSLQVPKGEGVIDLGSVPISQAGALAVTVGFPEGRPSEHLLLSVSLPPEPGNRARQGQPLASKPLDSNPVRIAEVAPGYVSLAIVDEQGREYYRQPTEVLAGQTTELTFTLVPISVSGYVSRGNAPVGDTRIEAKSEGKLFSTLSDSDGSYRLRVWSPGFFFLLAFPPGSPVPVASSLEIPEGSREFVRDISLPAGTVFGSVIDAATRTGIRDADVEYSRATQSDEGSPAVNAGVQTAGDGAFRIENLTQDALILTVSAKGYADRTVANVLPSDGGTSVTIELNRDDNAGGVVIDAAGNPIAGATVGVGLDPSRRFFMADTVSDSAGRFRFTGLGNGSYDVIGFRCGYKLGGSEIKVGDTSSSAHIVLDGPTSLTVHVEDAQRRAVSGLPLTFRIGNTPLPLEYPFRFLLGCGRSGSTDGDGDLAADYLPLGTITAFDTAGNALGSFSNDGLTPRWIIRVARSAPKR